MKTLTVNVWITAGIFSNHYLLERLPQAGSKIWQSDEEVSAIYQKIQGLYKKVNKQKWNEADTERRLIDKVFNELGFGYLNQNRIPEAERRLVPDYFLYSSPEEADKAFELSSHKKYRLAISIAEAKRWDHNLDHPSSGKGKALRGTYPHRQIRDYLSESEPIKWGILTNGKEWRLYFKEGRSSKFFEIDLEECLDDLQKFKYFYVLFRPAAFIKDSSGRCLLDNIYDESLRFQEDIEKDLREKVFKCVELLGHGFLSREENHLSEKDLNSVYHHSLILLYRILFVLNAEARDLLPTNPQTNYYKHYGIQRIKDRVSNEKGEFINAKTVLCDDLSSLFHLINGSNEKLNKDMNIPRYNGGLFDPEKYEFLEEKKVGDDVLSEVIYELSYRTENGDVHSIDYKGLGERHLGTVYEGLLEHKFDFENGKIVLKNDKGERKATGAYYTPDYIVKYIVENTLTPILIEIDERIKKGYKGDKDDSFAREVLKLNILDPAMGSGHFLVEAVQYLADEIAYHPTTDLKTPKGVTEDEINYWKRQVVESCIYGVDIKELAVELAKLSLWLKTVDKSQPLNFLDHHLRCGNSLIGARINDLNYLPQSKGKQKKSEEQDEQLVLFDKSVFKKDITGVIKGFHSIEEMPSEKLSDIKAKKKTFDELTEELVRYREIADLRTSLFFGNNLEEKEQVFEELLKDQFKYQKDIFGQDIEVIEKKKAKTGMTNQIYNFIVNTLQRPDGNLQIPKLGALLENSESIAREKNFFHWELEFPEVFFNEDGSPKENSGFDCVIGNPPYRTLALGKGQQSAEIDELEYLRMVYPESSQYKTNTFAMLFDNGIRLSCRNGKVGMILPLTILSNHFFANFRKLLLERHKIDNVVEIEQKVFQDAEIGGNSILLITVGVSDSLNQKILFTEIDKTLTFKNKVVIVQNDLLRLPDSKMLSNKATIELLLCLQNKNIFLKSIATFYNGIKTGNNEKFLSENPLTSKHRKVIRGRDIDRYHLDFGGIWVLFEPELLWSNTNQEMFEVQQKIIVRQTGDTLIGALDESQFYTMDTTHLIIPKAVNAHYLLTLINSTLLNWYHRQIVPEEGKAFAEVKIVNLEHLPIPRISFTTPEKERKEFFKEAVKLYGRSKHEDIIKWAEYELALKRNDTIHDFLAYLAEQMIELNKAKGNETKGFVKWLEREIGAGIDDLSNKTAIKEYHEHSFEHLLDVLKKNKNKLSIDPSNRKKQELLENHFTKSMLVLEPLKEKIKATDSLIDQIVYKLYGLTDKEIEIVEKSK